MCCLFGLIDYRGTLTAKQKTRLIRELSIAAEVRGTDATGIAYNTEHGRCHGKKEKERGGSRVRY